MTAHVAVHMKIFIHMKAHIAVHLKLPLPLEIPFAFTCQICPLSAPLPTVIPLARDTCVRSFTPKACRLEAHPATMNALDLLPSELPLGFPRVPSFNGNYSPSLPRSIDSTKRASSATAMSGSVPLTILLVHYHLAFAVANPTRLLPHTSSSPINSTAGMADDL
jgi:hypothetical protein